MIKFPRRVVPTQPAEDRDVGVMARLRAGDANALEELLDRHWGPIVAYVGRMLSNRDAGEDIAQEVFLRVWQQRIEWRPVGSLRAFLFSVARHLALNEQKKRSREVRHLPRYRADLQLRRPVMPSQSVERTEIRTALERALNALPPRRREVFLLARAHGLSYKEIADVMEISPQTVANQLSAAVAELRGALRYLIDV